MWWRLLFSRLFLQLLRILLIPAVAFVLGAIILTLFAVISYVYVFTNTLQIIPRNPTLGILLLLLEILLFVGLILVLCKGYHHLKVRVHHKLEEERR